MRQKYAKAMSCLLAALLLTGCQATPSSVKNKAKDYTNSKDVTTGKEEFVSVDHLLDNMDSLLKASYQNMILADTIRIEQPQSVSVLQLEIPKNFANKNKVSLEDLKEYPRLSYEQGEHNSFYFSEEILSTLESQKEIKVCDRATLFNLLIGLNGYTICSGVINEQLNGKDIIAVPLDVNDFMEIGYITHNKAILSRFGQFYIDILKEYTKKDS